MEAGRWPRVVVGPQIDDGAANTQTRQETAARRAAYSTPSDFEHLRETGARVAPRAAPRSRRHARPARAERGRPAMPCRPSVFAAPKTESGAVLLDFVQRL
jgi:hypothetical protein